MRLVLPFTHICFFIASLAIMGFPFLTGFYSKDIILEFTYSRYIIDSLFIYSLGLLAALLTASYSVKLLYFIFSQQRKVILHRSYLLLFKKSSIECPLYMFISMFLLALCSIFIGFIFSDLFIGYATDSFMKLFLYYQNILKVLMHSYSSSY